MIARINFTKLTSFNIVLFTVVDDVKKLKDKMMEEGATHAQTGHFYVQNKPSSDSHGKIQEEHFSFQADHCKSLLVNHIFVIATVHFIINKEYMYLCRHISIWACPNSHNHAFQGYI